MQPEVWCDDLPAAQYAQGPKGGTVHRTAWMGLLAACGGWGTSSELGPHEGPVQANLVRPVHPRTGWLGNTVAPEPAIEAQHCAALDHGGPVMGPDCVTATVGCGDTIVGHTRGGVDQFPTAAWEQHFCWPATVDHDSGDERVYRLDLPDGEWRASVWLDSPCADLDLMALRHHGDTCPTLGHTVPQCESMLKEGPVGEHIELVSQGKASWYLVVEGRGAAEGAFALQVECRPGVR